jgi:Tfp pilus assembly protein PilF
MRELICEQCGATFAAGLADCSTCGARAENPRADVDQRVARVQHLLGLARQCHQDNDVTTALRHAREALSLDPDSTTIHALLGQLYEQSGNEAAARYHFQAALSVAAKTGDSPQLIDTSGMATPPRNAGWMTWVLVGCLLCSGLAVVFAFWDGDRHTDERAAILQMELERPPLRHTPRWTWRVPAPLPEATTVPPASAPVETTTTPTTAEHNEPVVATQESVEETVEPLARPPSVLGPSALDPGALDRRAATIESADRAYFAGKYEHAVTMYEELLRNDEHASPRLHQDLAWCYQHLGNSTKAAEHLTAAVKGYRALVTRDPQNTAAEQGLQRSEAALRVLLDTRTTPVEP